MNGSDPRPSPLSPMGSLIERLRRRLRWPVRPSDRPSGGTVDRPGGRDVSAARLRVQVGVIRDAFAEHFGDESVAAAPGRGAARPRDDADTAYLYRPGCALVRESDLERIAAYIDERPDIYDGGIDRAGSPAPDLVLITLPPRKDEQDAVLATLDEVDVDLGEGLLTPDHIIYVTAKPGLCPATEPELPPSLRSFPLPAEDTSLGKDIRVSVVDTGWWKAAAKNKKTPWVAGVTADPEDEEKINAAAIHPYGGHGTFVAGVVRCMAPAAEVDVEGALTHGGAVYESELVTQLDQALKSELFPQLISISAGTHTRKSFALLSFEMLASTYGLDDGEKTLIVAAAGNDSDDKPFWPAAFPWVVSVGSVDPNGKVSDFSNVGNWVDVYARGSKHVNAFPTGTYTCYEPPNVGQVRTFDGLAQWSGTSFSTPLVTGLIAARMSATGEDARKAADAVLGAGAASIDPRGGKITTVGPLQ
ncbi:MAG: S8/S53 family peptidase [Propionibacteriales bacterium]|nr:S8/S53 family peptidase [Propionibacteriales bacterium]